MGLRKYDIKGERYVKLDELNGMLNDLTGQLAEKIDKFDMDDKSRMRLWHERFAIYKLQRMVNEADEGEKYVIFSRDSVGDWEFFMELVKWDDIPAFVRKHLSRRDGEDYVSVGTNNIDKAELYDCEEDAQDALAAIQVECKGQDWHYTKRRMFDDKDGEDALLTLYYDGHVDTQKSAEPESNESPKADKERRKRACPGRYTVWYRNDEDTTQHCMGFVRFEKGIPIFTNRPCKATWFTWKRMAEQVANKCGEGFEVVDMIDQMTAEERLLRAIFREDGMDDSAADEVCEYHGDGTRAEDEDWDGEDSD